jgi:proteasome accessory factor A
MMLTPKILGADIELGNAWRGGSCRSNLEAASRVVRAVEEKPAFGSWSAGTGQIRWQGEWDRHWLQNGGCLYVDMSHVEACTPETTSARDHTAAVHAMLRIVRACRRQAQARLPEGEDLFVNVHVSDGTFATSWGAHQNVAISRALWDDIFHERRPHVMALLASVVAAMVPVFGQGLVLPLKHGCRYATSARAHHIGSMVTLTTTEPFNRGLLNRRDEPLADDPLARLHLIAFDANLMPATILLRSGLLQLVLAALELGWFDSRLLLDDPVEATQTWSLGFCPDAGAFRPQAVCCPGGARIGLFPWHHRLSAGLRRLVHSGRIPESVVPEGGMILDLWAETLVDLEQENMDRLASRLDWALKWRVLSELTGPPAFAALDDPRLRLLDQLYGHVDDGIGLFWQFWREGLIDRVIDDAAIGRFIAAGDPRTRSGLRGELVRRLRPWIVDVNWHYCELARAGSTWWRASPRRRLVMPDPAAASGAFVAELKGAFPRDEQLFDYLMETPDGDPMALSPVSTNLDGKETPHVPRALPPPSPR